MGNFLLLRYFKSLICNSVAELRTIKYEVIIELCQQEIMKILLAQFFLCRYITSSIKGVGV